MIGLAGIGQNDVGQACSHDPAALTFEEALETTKIHSVAGVLDAGAGLVGVRPFARRTIRFLTRGCTGGGISPRP